MKIEQFMTKFVVTVDIDDSLKVVKDIFDNVSFHHLFVVESGKLFGVISDRDLLKALSPYIGTINETTRDLSILNKKVSLILTRNPVTLTTKSGIYDAIDVFNNYNISCIPIVDEERKLVGIISWRDILKTIAVMRTSYVNNVNAQA